MRKDLSFVPADRIIVLYQNSELFGKIIQENKKEILEEVLADEIQMKENIPAGKEVEIEQEKIILGIQKNN